MIGKLALASRSRLPSVTTFRGCAERRSVAVKRLGPPAPSDAELEQILRSALAAPDHGALRPWRIVICAPQSRERLAELFVAGQARDQSVGNRTRTRSRAGESTASADSAWPIVAAPKPGLEHSRDRADRECWRSASIHSPCRARPGLRRDHAERQPLRGGKCPSGARRRGRRDDPRLHQHRHHRGHAKAGLAARPCRRRPDVRWVLS